jgi:hypothetical protein
MAATIEELSPERREEICRRCNKIKPGTAGIHDAEDVFAKAYAELT